MHNVEKNNPQRIIRSIDEVDAGLGAAGYIASRQISTAVYIAHHLKKPILVEGPARKNPEELCGRTENNRVVNFECAGRAPIGRFIEVEITAAMSNSLRGRMISGRVARCA